MQCFDTKRISAYVLMQEVCQIWNTKKKPWKHCVSKAFWQVASIRIFCFSRFRHQSVEVTLIIFVLNDIDRFFRCQQLV